MSSMEGEVYAEAIDDIEEYIDSIDDSQYWCLIHFR